MGVITDTFDKPRKKSVVLGDGLTGAFLFFFAALAALTGIFGGLALIFLPAALFTLIGGVFIKLVSVVLTYLLLVPTISFKISFGLALLLYVIKWALRFIFTWGR